MVDERDRASRAAGPRFHLRSALAEGAGAAAVAVAIALAPLLPWWSAVTPSNLRVALGWIALVGPGIVLGWRGRRWWPAVVAVATFAGSIVDERVNSPVLNPEIRYLEVYVLYAVVYGAIGVAATATGMVARAAVARLRGARVGPTGRR